MVTVLEDLSCNELAERLSKTLTRSTKSSSASCKSSSVILVLQRIRSTSVLLTRTGLARTDVAKGMVMKSAKASML